MNFQQTINAAIADLLQYGYDSEQRLQHWMREIAEAARRSLIPESKLQSSVASMLQRVYARELKALSRNHEFLSQFTLAQIKPKLRDELDRRILASAGLIRLNREASIQRTLQRFAGWATSVPKGGTDVANRREIKKTVRRGIAGLPFEERRVVIDQGHKLAASINDIAATNGGAIAATWRHVRRGPPSYESRPEHVARDGLVFLVRDSWAHREGLVKPGKTGYTDDVDQPAELPLCGCKWQFVFALRDLPSDMLTAKGKAALAEARNAIRRIA